LAFAGWHHWDARVLLITGIGYAALLLLADRFRRR
jgi:thiosulfate reductase cytochrome b subunit